ncbi:MAG: DUF3619 family protein [Rhodocyclaceae bacterium]|nr:DUF3619 family protein [Rhodocyclaceae bacterium]
MNEELQFALKIRQVLNHGTDNLDPGTARRLFEARQKALAAQAAPVAGLRLAGLGGLLTDTFMHRGRTFLAGMALCAGVVGTYYWNQFEQAKENEEIDSALLTDELPPEAYLDRGFQAWLEKSSRSSE